MSGGQKGVLGGAVLHGHSKGGKRSKEYRAWIGMKQRCRQHPHYLKHGVKVCEEWQGSFSAFLNHIGRVPTEHHTVDRINPEGHYEPGNVRWATIVQQRHNRRPGAKAPQPPWTGKTRPLFSGEWNPSAKLTWVNVRDIRRCYCRGDRLRTIAALFMVTRQTVADIVLMRTWRQNV